MKKKIFVYQIFTRLFGKKINTNLKNGEIWENVRENSTTSVIMY
jgi:hypothetical protein